jgi:gliding motility-associated-like protein
MAGEYVLHVLDSNHCLLIDTIIISQPLPYQAFASTTSSLICESDSGYLLIDSVLGGGNISYGFIGLNTDSIYVPSGFYDIFINDLDFGCIDTVPVRCYAQYEIEVFNTIIDNSCFGNALGVVVIDSILGGNIPYDVQWGGLNSNALEANTYTVLIVDSIGCVHAEEFTITQPNQIDPNSVHFTPSCYGDSDGSIVIDPSGGTGSLSYYWLSGTGFPDSLFGLSAGVYTLVVSDSLLCVDSFDFFLSEPDSLIISFSNFQDSLACYGEVIVLNLLIFGGTAPFSVLWNDGNTNQQRIIGAGNYSCTVTDANGCIAADSFVIIEPELLSINLTYSEITCDEGAAASISINGGVEPIDVIWNTGETLMSIDSLWGTIYWVVVTDSCGNSASDTFQISPYLLETSVFYDDSTHVGDVEIDTCSSVGTFSYQWVDILGNVISNNNLTSHLCEGTYFVTANDNTTNCSVIDTLIATYYLPNGIIDETITTVLPDSNLWGNPPYSYFWDNGEILAHANICPGAHWVEVTDNFDCVVRADFDIDPLLIALDPSEFIIECNLENLDVDITATPSGGTGPYTYSWSNGSTENSINLSLSPGNYSVTIMDNNACIEDTSFVISTMSADCVPNVFTPNGDNINDTWNLENTFLYSDSKIKIYGRYGRLLFKSVGYSTPWDGKNENGNDVSEGAYFYHIEVGHDFDAIKGSVTIIR